MCNIASACGCSKNSAVLSKIVGGEAAKPSSWGWSASLRVNDKHICGGTILSAFYIITAAHCITHIPALSMATIAAGISNLSQTGQTRSLAKTYVHPKFDPDTYVNDIAIIRLKTPLNMEDFLISKICLPTINSELLRTQGYPIIGTSLVAIGWGTLKSDSKLVSTTLQQITIQVVSNKAVSCRQILEHSTLQFCAGIHGGGKGKRNWQISIVPNDLYKINN
ncbi:unnamed protein product [Didymodactylos carnosus]|uniref:Peptidase S1 domain-containing protein n=1 Tax=Didymodactylos carnosus TaxID=1234261 RepID=A0A8S2I0P2_9BILA|nr:unnamed protein product [Didymodactylos carnosus]CAF3685687.1 unnamed protein product [Didymodactylos carnosus]